MRRGIEPLHPAKSARCWRSMKRTVGNGLHLTHSGLNSAKKSNFCVRGIHAISPQQNGNIVVLDLWLFWNFRSRYLQWFDIWTIVRQINSQYVCHGYENSLSSDVHRLNIRVVSLCIFLMIFTIRCCPFHFSGFCSRIFRFFAGKNNFTRISGLPGSMPWCSSCDI